MQTDYTKIPHIYIDINKKCFELIILYLYINPAQVKIILCLLIKKQDNHIKNSVNSSKVASLTMKYQASVQQQEKIHDVQQQIPFNTFMFKG